MKINIPGSVAAAQEVLAGIEGLVTAKDWERAAIVAAFVVQPGAGARTDLVTSDKVLSPTQFAALGIAGLRSVNTVVRYVEAWETTGLGRPTPGEEFEATNLGEFPRTSKTTDTSPGAQKVKDISANTNAMKTAITINPKVAAAAREALQAADSTRAASLKAYGNKIKNDPDLKAVDSKIAAHDDFRVKVTDHLTVALEEMKAASAGWDNHWDGATGIQKALAIETVLALQAEIGVLSMYVSTESVND
jgi:hypothetical protein